ncbi:MAG: hypothetical protein U0176_06855 [Bacteroidia bacterium]
MKGTRFYAMLSLLSAQERQRFQRELGQNPSASLAAKLALLTAQHLEATLQDGQDLPWHKEEIWKLLKPGEEFQPSYFKNLVSDAQGLLEWHLILQSLQADPLMRDTLLLGHLLDRGAPQEMLAALWRSTHSQATKRGESDAGNLRRLWEIAVAIERRNPDRRQRLRTSNTGNTWPESPDEAAEAALDAEYLLAKLRLATENLIRGRALSDAGITSSLSLEQILKEVPATVIERYPLLRLQILCYQLLATGEGYPAYKQEIIDAHLPGHALFELVIHAQNHCIARSNTGERHYLEDYVGWMDFRQQRDILLLNGELPPSELKNYVTACLKLGDPSRAAQFLDQFGSHVAEGFREKAVSLNRAHIAYHKQEYSLARKLLASHPVLDQFDELDWRSLQLKIHCALIQQGGETDDLFTFIHSFRNFLYRSKALPATRTSAHLRKLNYIERAHKNPKPAKLEKLRAEVEGDMEVADREWVLGVVG